MTDEENKIKRVFTTYDPSLHEKVFIVKGEEDYARTTDTVLTEILHESGTGIDPETGRREDWNHWITHLKLEFRVEVKRNVGKGAVILYDNDAPLTDAVAYEDNTEYVEWKYEDSETDNRVRLAYGVEHNITARYMENTECLPSVSKSYRFDEPIPTKFESTLSFVGLSEDYAPSSTISFQVKLESENLTDDKEVSVYVDNELYDDEVAIDGDTGLSETITLSNLDYGLHKVYAIFHGDNEVYACDKEDEFGYGYKFVNPVIPLTVVSGSPITTNITITNYHDEPISGVGVKMRLADHSQDISSSVTTDSSGIATITTSNMTNQPFVFTSNNQDSSSYTVYIINVLTEISANVLNSIATPQARIDYSLSESGSVIAMKGIPINVTINSQSSIKYTNDDGVASFVYDNQGIGNLTVTASVDGLNSIETEINDPLVYLNPKNPYNPSMISLSDGAVLDKTSRGYLLRQQSSSSNLSLLSFPVDPSENWCMEFDYSLVNWWFELYINGIALDIWTDGFIPESGNVKVKYDSTSNPPKCMYYTEGELTYTQYFNDTSISSMNIGVKNGESAYFNDLFIERWNK